MGGGPAPILDFQAVSLDVLTLQLFDLRLFDSSLFDSCFEVGVVEGSAFLAGSEGFSPAEELPALLLSEEAVFLPYSVAYQPEPFNRKEDEESRRSSLPPQWGHFDSGGSENFRIFSIRFPHLEHLYS